MRGIIWGQTLLKTRKQLEIIKNNYFHSGIKVLRETKNEVIFENGDYWQALQGNEYSRGYRVNISYIDEFIPKEIVNKIILPSTTAIPYNAYKYF